MILGAAVDNIVLPLAPPGKPYKLSPDEKYLCKMTKTKLPFVPVVRKEEKMLFNRMLLGMEGTPDFDKMAIDWCMHVDGVNIFPKLPVYLRRHYSNYLHSQQVRDAVANAAPGEVKLRQLNEQFGVEALLRERNTTVDANPTLYLMPTVSLCHQPFLRYQTRNCYQRGELLLQVQLSVVLNQLGGLRIIQLASEARISHGKYEHHAVVNTAYSMGRVTKRLQNAPAPNQLVFALVDYWVHHYSA